MKFTIIRHFPTYGNLNRKYIGITDEDICCRTYNFDYSSLNSKYVFVSPMKRAIQTAEILFPKSSFIVIQELKEMNFGKFENKNYIELSNDKDYISWLDSNCEMRCPQGESREEFCKRTVHAFEKIEALCKEKNLTEAVIVAHGGTAMAAAESLCNDKFSYFDIKLSFGEAFSFET